MNSPKSMTTKLQNSRTIVVAVSVAFILSVSSVFADWSPPKVAPPACPTNPSDPNFHEGCLPPLNQGGTAQFKSGNLGVGGIFTVNSESYLYGNVGIGLDKSSAETAKSPLSVRGDATILRPNVVANSPGYQLSLESYDAGSISTDRTTPWVSQGASSAGDDTPDTRPGKENIEYECQPGNPPGTYTDIAKLGTAAGFYKSTIVCKNNTASYSLRANGGVLEFLDTNGAAKMILTQSGKLGLGTTSPAGAVTVSRNGAQWSAWNYGANLVVGGDKTSDRHPAIALLDHLGSLPFSISNVSGDLIVAAMPGFANTTSGPSVRVTIKRNDPNANFQVNGNALATKFVDNDVNYYADLDWGARIGGNWNLLATGGGGGNFTAAGKLDGSQLCISGDCRNSWAAVGGGGPAYPGVAAQPFTSIFYNTYPGNGVANINNAQWTECWFETNGGAGAGAVQRTLGSGSCHFGNYVHTVGGTNYNKFFVFAACPAGQKVLSGGSLRFANKTEDVPGDIAASFPATYGMYNSWKHVGSKKDDPAGGWDNNTEGWMISGNNSAGYDGMQANVLCGY